MKAGREEGSSKTTTEGGECTRPLGLRKGISSLIRSLSDPKTGGAAQPKTKGGGKNRHGGRERDGNKHIGLSTRDNILGSVKSNICNKFEGRKPRGEGGT